MFKMTTQHCPELLRHHLNMGECVVVFLKRDGTLRTMRCTLSPYLVPLTARSDDNSVSDPNLFRVFDIEKGDWRSFRMDQVLNYSWNMKIHDVPTCGTVTVAVTVPQQKPASAHEPKAVQASSVPVTTQIAFGFKPMPSAEKVTAEKVTAEQKPAPTKTSGPQNAFVNRFGQTIYPGDRVVVFATCQNTSGKQYLGEYVGMSPGASPQVKVFVGQSWSTRTYPNGSVYKLADN